MGYSIFQNLSGHSWSPSLNLTPLLEVSESRHGMKSTKSRYQQVSITRIPRARGFAWRVRYSEWASWKRIEKSFTFSGAKYPTESDVRKAIELAVSQQNRETERARVDVSEQVPGSIIGQAGELVVHGCPAASFPHL